VTAAAAWAHRYCEIGLALTPLEGKRPIREAWNVDRNLIRSPDEARAYWRAHPAANMGACLSPSGLVSVDVDYPEGAHLVLAQESVDLEALIRLTPTVVGRAPRLEFKAPAATLGRKSVVWPPRAPGEKPVTVIELRAGRLQDVLPPSIHPDTHRPYTWRTPPKGGFPPLPEELLALWQDFEVFKHRARNLCPWAQPEPDPEFLPPRAPREHTGASVIEAFNQAHDAVAILESHGYERAGKRRWKSPNGHGVAGVVLLESGKVYCHHASDTALAGEHALDAFDLFRLLDHGGDYRAATRAAARLLRLDERARHG
jgi:putative DNA primase/helicase